MIYADSQLASIQPLDQEVTTMDEPKVDDEGTTFGPWMLVQSKRRQPLDKRGNKGKNRDATENEKFGPIPTLFLLLALRGYVAAPAPGLMSNAGSSLGTVSGLTVTRTNSEPSKQTGNPPSFSNKSLVAGIVIKKGATQLSKDSKQGTYSQIVSKPISSVLSLALTASKKEVIGMEVDNVVTDQIKHDEKVINKLGFDNSTRVGARVFSGGIWMLWNSDIGRVHVFNKTAQFILVLIENRDQKPWAISAIYTSPIPSIRELVWQFLSTFNGLDNTLWVFIRDFNRIMSHDEKQGEAHECEIRMGLFYDDI
ncbi:hypothetical protein REPUB_Repub03eG0196200 [Reevesia pubescens]